MGNKYQCLLVQSESDGDIGESNKESKKSYTREFLSSFAELDTCKTLPSGFDPTILSELNDAWSTTTYGDSVGLLGAIPRFSGYGSEDAAPNVQDQGECVLSRSNKPYRPPHFYKAILHSENQNRFLYNHQTVSSSGCPSQEKLEKEQGRTDSFELMRKEQHVIQEKRKQVSDAHQENVDPEIVLFLEDSEEDKILVKKCNASAECVASSAPNNSSADQQCDVIADLTKGSLVYSSIAIHQLLEGMKPVGGISSDNKSGNPELYTVSDYIGTERCSLFLPARGIELPHKLMRSTSPSATSDNLDQFYSCSETIMNPGVLTCEDFDTINLFESGKDNMLDISRGENSENFQKNLTGRQIFRADISKDVKSIEASVSQKGPVSWVARNDNLESGRFLFSVDNSMIHLTEDRSTGIGQEGIGSPSDAKQPCLNKMNGKPSLYDDIKALIGLDLDSDEDTKLSAFNGFDEKSDSTDELLLPEEESLITVDDSIFLQESMVMSAGNSMKVYPFTSTESAKAAENFAILNAILSDSKSTQSDLGVSASICIGHNVKGLGTGYYNPLTQQSYQPLHQSQMRSTGAFVHPSQFQEAHKIKFLDVDFNHYTPPGHQNFPTSVFSDSFPLKCVMPAQLFSPHIDPMLQHISIPGEGQPDLLNELAGDELKQYPITEMACYARAGNPLQNFFQYYQQQSYLGHQALNPNLGAAANRHEAACCPYFKIGAKAKQMDPPALSGLAWGTFGKRVGRGNRGENDGL